MTGRFDNLSLEQLVEREREAYAEHKAIADALQAAMLAECPLKVGFVYRFGPDAAWMRVGVEFLVCSLRPDREAFSRPPRYYLGVHGFLATKRSTAGDGFGRSAKVIRDWRVFDLASERPSPRASLQSAAEIAEVLAATGMG